MSQLAFLETLEQIIDARLTAGGEQSYTARLAAAGTMAIAQKVGEEGVETALAAVGESPERLVSETADLVFHLLVLLRVSGRGLADVAAELERRHRG